MRDSRDAHLEQHLFELVVERLAMGELAIILGEALETCMIKLTWELGMHVKAFLAFGTTIHEIELTKFHFQWRESVVRVRTFFSLQPIRVTHLTDANDHTLTLWHLPCM